MPQKFAERPCVGCGQTYEPTGHHTKWCAPCRLRSENVTRRENERRRRERDPERWAVLRRAKYQRARARNPERFRSKERRSRATPGGKIAQRDAKRRREMRLRGVASIPYRAQDIFDRDGWRCHLCQKPVIDKAGLMGPSLDHLIPVSAGGPDTPDNVRLAHFTCNSRRGVGGEVQLLLIA